MPSSTNDNFSPHKGFLSRAADSLSSETAEFMSSNPSVLPSGMPMTLVSASPGLSGNYFRHHRTDSRPPHDISYHDRSVSSRSSAAKVSAPSHAFATQGQPSRHHTSTRYGSPREAASSHPRNSEPLDNFSNQFSSTLKIPHRPSPTTLPHNRPYLAHRKETQSTPADLQWEDTDPSSSLPARTLRQPSILAPAGPAAPSEPPNMGRTPLRLNTSSSVYTSPSPSASSSLFPSSPASSTTEVSSIGTQRSKQRGKRNKDRKQSKLADAPVAPPASPMSSVNVFMPGYSMSFAAHGRSTEPHQVSTPQRPPPFNTSRSATESRSPRSSFSSADASGSWRRSEGVSDPPSSPSPQAHARTYSLVEPQNPSNTSRQRFLGISFGKKKVQTVSTPTSPLGRTSQASHQQSNCYPSKSHDAILLDHDRRTGELLRRLNPTVSPSFHGFGDSPPASALDLGCGQGYWLLEAAVSWKRSRTRVTGFDMVDVTKDMWPSAVKQGVAGSIRFVQGNFLKQTLPFPDKSFDFVRMANLTLCIPRDKWESVLLEVRRVLTVGGRLELIDDQIFFPYGKVPTPGASFPPEPSSHSNSRRHDRTSQSTRPLTSYTSTSSPPSKADSQWFQQATASKELEDRFERMLFDDFGISIRPSEFVPDLLMRVFGQAREVSTMHLMLAPPNSGHGGSSRGGGSAPSEHKSNVLAQSPGLVLWPSTSIPITAAELEVHATKHPCILLATEDLLVEHATQGSRLHGNTLLEALRKYEGFLRYRFDSPDTAATALHDHGIQGIRNTTSPHYISPGIDLTHVRTFHVYVATRNVGALGE